MVKILWIPKALRCILSKNKPIQQIEILECLFFDKMEQLSDPDRRKNYSTALTIALSSMVKNEVITRFKYPGIKGYFYADVKWCIKENGEYKLLPEYETKLDEAITELIK